MRLFASRKLIVVGLACFAAVSIIWIWFFWFDHLPHPSWSTTQPELGSRENDVLQWCAENKLSYGEGALEKGTSFSTGRAIPGAVKVMVVQGEYQIGWLARQRVTYYFYLDNHSRLIHKEVNAFVVEL